MPKRTSLKDADRAISAADLEDIVTDKREGWRANSAKARRRQRRYKNKLTQEIMSLAKGSNSDTPY
jgi:hypothetical protein